MKKAIYSFSAVIICALAVFLMFNNFSNNNKVQASQANKAEEKIIVNTDYTPFEDIFTPAFQLIWNDFTDKVVGGKVEFVGENPKIVEDLNQRRLEESMLSPKDYYKTVAPQTVKTKKTIEKSIKKQFNEKSQLLDSINWMKRDDGIHKVLYCMFKKDIFFPKVFEELAPAPFLADKTTKETYKMFGTTSNQKKFASQVIPVYYENKDDYAVKLLTKTGDEIILMTSTSDEPVLKIWDDFYANKLSQNTYHLTFDKNSKLIVPFIKLSKTTNYNELTGRQIVNSNVIIDTALEVIDFSLDNTGAKIKNEAMMGVRTTALRPHGQQRLYYFNRPFVLFIRSKDGKVPYFALKIKDTKYLEVK